MIRLKVCGMRDEGNLKQLIQVGPDYIGFIFYKKSKRFVGDNDAISFIKPLNIQKVGVFVNEENGEIVRHAKALDLHMIQLHGDESPAQAEELKSLGLKVIKVFSVSNQLPGEELSKFKKAADYFLLDTKTEAYGGSGQRFDWSVLKDYDNEVPLFLSGGIGEEHLEEISDLNKKLNIHAIDVNSRFEITPALKNIVSISSFAQKLKAL
ncbi:MAG: phosphoribosylanthranilate isomerase [Sporocytophaga sp.]|nr:phosphoribosylanthranilate isomerase [Sporocytophaga sp.]